MKKRILIIDDKPAIGQLISIYLGNDYQTHTVLSAVSAMEWLHNKKTVDLIISDYSMPEMNGFEFLMLLKGNELFKHIPIIFLSGEDSTATRIKLLENGADDFILKPFNPMELRLRINKALK
ncbi:response regulator [Sphingobacterium hotanense]|uniref:response regulator n=1 Tax=Sphingobacterium hotanense TaxID=649196 RepID=UPI0021A28FE1|nr:response regulator transcription factor [Sphingobacterium hotanense]MCT1524687.1 response regulator transcription factor [Sphingobacterium hotanense]